MFESLLMGGGVTIPRDDNLVCSITDPGVCFYGEVSQAEFITVDQLETLVNYNSGGVRVPASAHANWLKFSIDSKIIYFLKTPIRHTISNINDRTALINTDFIHKGVNYRCRPLKANGTSGTSNDPEGEYGTENNRIFYRLISRSGVSGEGIPFGELGKYNTADLHLGSQDGSRILTDKGKGEDRHGRRFLLNYYGTVVGAPNERGWRPLIEMLN